MLCVNERSKKQTKSSRIFFFRIRLRRRKRKKFFGRSDIMAPGISYRKLETRWLTRLSASESKRWGKRLRECNLGFGDEICIYHRDGEICDHAIQVGLHILKVHSVKSKQPRTTCFARVRGMPPPLATYEVRDRLGFHRSFHLSFCLSFADVGAFIIGLLTFSHSKFQLDKLLLSIQA